MIKLSLRDFIKKYNTKVDTMKELELQRVYNYPIYSRDSKISSDKGFVNIANGSMGGTHWCAFYVENIKSPYFDRSGGLLDKLLVNQLPKPKMYHNNKIHGKKSILCGTYSLDFFYLIERMTYYDTFSKNVIR